YVTDGAWSGRRGRAERATWPRGNRRPNTRNRGHTSFCPRSVQPLASSGGRHRHGRTERKCPINRPWRGHPCNLSTSLSIYMSTTTYSGGVGLISDENKADPVRSRRRHRRIIIVGSAVFLIALVVGFIPQCRQRQTATADTNQLAIPTVGVVTPTLTTPGSGLNLPAEVKPWQEASIFARANGFLKSWLVD